MQGGSRLPQYGEWLGTREAARVWREVMGMRISPETVRRLCRDGDLEQEGVLVWRMTSHYYIEKGSLLAYFGRAVSEAHERAARAVREHRAAGPADKE
jgi:hypothetical protein